MRFQSRSDLRLPIFRLALAGLAAAGIVLASLLPAAARGSATILPTLYVNYSSSCTFTITNDSGGAVTTIASGTYQLLVQTPGDFGTFVYTGGPDMTDCQGMAQFQLSGPGVLYQTTLDDGDSDTALITVTLKDNATYTATDQNQPSVARVTFATTASAPAPTVPTTYATGTVAASKTSGKASTVFRGTLLAVVNADGTLALTSSGGKPVSQLESGRYTFRVTDSSKTLGFKLTGKAGTEAMTSGAYVGSKTVTVTLAPGQWSFFPDGFHQRSYFVVLP
jgi:hypothetical protein